MLSDHEFHRRKLEEEKFKLNLEHNQELTHLKCLLRLKTEENRKLEEKCIDLSIMYKDLQFYLNNVKAEKLKCIEAVKSDNVVSQIPTGENTKPASRSMTPGASEGFKPFKSNEVNLPITPNKCLKDEYKELKKEKEFYFEYERKIKKKKHK